MEKYKFNKEKLEFVEVRRGLKWWGRKIFQYLFVSILLAVLYYCIFALFISTEAERQLAKENKILAQEYEKLSERLGVLDNTVSNLKIKDREIYRSIFSADPLIVSLINQGSPLLDNLDTTKDHVIVSKSREMIVVMEENASSVQDMLNSIVDECDYLGRSVAHVPAILPIRDFSVGQTGASIGKRMNPFYKTVTSHDGMDLLAALGTDVLATADGVIVESVRSKRGSGNYVTIDHKNGYMTTYSHLGDVLVKKGKTVSRGEVIGRVGLSGMSFAPHLHYKVTFNDKVVDPINYFFADLTPEQFREVIAISSNTGQSLD
ncbi:MAG: M23 family metallopeptidase [Bacteroidales bacterium]|nr:M23 family metallopeptidase [Bacteroidales bacterium]